MPTKGHPHAPALSLALAGAECEAGSPLGVGSAFFNPQPSVWPHQPPDALNGFLSWSRALDQGPALWHQATLNPHL